MFSYEVFCPLFIGFRKWLKADELYALRNDLSRSETFWFPAIAYQVFAQFILGPFAIFHLTAPQVQKTLPSLNT